ncbi:unnamed protein product [Orchesella dallaii]|uniref:Secreted protein n=1 Tax=Orchesella dallaii TaxID=48710 RepID=A0ABP1QX91_9HEXA
MARIAVIALFLIVCWQSIDLSIQEREVLIRDRLVLVLCDQLHDYLDTGNFPGPITKLPEKYKSSCSKAGETYDGHYDISARNTAYLCELMDEYLKTGKQPSLSKTSPKKLDKKKFTNGKPCWKFSWMPCDAATYAHTNQRPCGYYQMAKAPETECD